MQTGRITPKQFMWLCTLALLLGVIRFAWIPWIQQVRAQSSQITELQWALEQARPITAKTQAATPDLHQAETAALNAIFYESPNESVAIAALLKNLQAYAKQAQVTVQSVAPRRVAASVEPGQGMAMSLVGQGKPTQLWHLLYLLSVSIPLHSVTEASVRPGLDGNVDFDLVVESVWQVNPYGTASQPLRTRQAVVSWERAQRIMLFATPDKQLEQPPAPEPPSLTLTGIVYGQPQSVATLKDPQGRAYAVRVGDEVAGAKVESIQPHGVVLSVAGREYQLQLSN